MTDSKTLMTHNEAAGRLHRNIDIFLPASQKQTRGSMHEDLDDALAAERRATVERIRERISERGFAGQDWVRSVLDEEAAR